MPARKRFGQHFLAPAWADKLIEAIEPRAQDRFLEIGPGPGALTLRLAPRVAHLTAVEIDRDLAAALQPRLPANVALIVADILDTDLRSLLAPGPLRVAGNLPYNISSPILFRLIGMATGAANSTPPNPPFDSAPPRSGQAIPPAMSEREIAREPNGEPALARRSAERGGGSPRPAGEAGLIDATLMLQREVAKRLEARPGTGDYGVLSISVQLHADVKRLLTLPPGAFRPAPKVHSAVVRLTFRPPAAAPRDEGVFEAMVRSMFTQRRKTLANALAPFAGSRGMDAVAALGIAGIDPRRRPETLDLEELTRLADRFVLGLSR